VGPRKHNRGARRLRFRNKATNLPPITGPRRTRSCAWVVSNPKDSSSAGT